MMEHLSDARHRATHPAGSAAIGRVRSRVGASAVVAVIAVEARGRLVVSVEDDAEYLPRLHHAERLADEPARCAVGPYHEQEAVDPVGDEPAVLDGTERRC